MKESKAARKAPVRSRKVEPPRKKAQPQPRPPDQEKAIEEFAAGVRLYQKGDLGRAKEQFKSLLEKYPQQREIGDRARTYIQVCDRALQAAAPRLKDLDDYYYHGVVLLNQQNLEEAVRVFEKALTIDQGSEKVLYALAAAMARSGRSEAAVDTLRRSVAANPSNRVMAAGDADFESLREHPDFRALIHGRSPEGA